MMTALSIMQSIPDGFLTSRARDLHNILTGPTFIELPGEYGAPLFVSILLHGNEDSGLGAVQILLRGYEGKRLPRPLMLLVGNVAAASEGQRRLDGQPDYNRIWPGTGLSGELPEAAIMADVHQRVVASGAFAAIDIHNNTGRNPHYGVICTQDDNVERLASKFAPRAVLFRGLPGTQTASFTGLIPAMTAECGQPGNAENAEAAARFLEEVINLPDLKGEIPAERDLDLFHTMGVVRVRPEIALGLKDGSWLSLDEEIESLNFHRADAGTVFGATNHPMPIKVIDEDGRDVAEQHFQVREGALLLRAPAIPAMLTLDQRIIRQDCLCYLMEHLD
jgi:hypothetical protein